MERRRNFSTADLNYLANLCHNCGECLDACQYAPPHEFAVDVPRALREIRVRSYGAAGAWLPLATFAIGLAVGLFGVRRDVATADFYAAIPHSVMAAVFGAVGIAALALLFFKLRQHWRESGDQLPITAAALNGALQDALTLRYLSARPRSLFHHLTFYGFALCFASTTVAAIYHYVFGWRAPYVYSSLPVLLGTLGGVGLVAGPIGLLLTNRPSDRAFVVLLASTSATGLLLLALRETRAMPALLAIHLAAVLAFFVTAPYGKFAHGFFRVAALLRHTLEQSRGE